MDATKKVLKIILNDDETEIDRIENTFKIHYPLFMRNYRDAFNAISESIYNYNKKLEEIGKICETRYNYMQKIDNSDYYLKNENNIIAFIGERGSGKTTAVNEFGRLMQNFYNTEIDWFREIQLARFDSVKAKMRFHVMDSIDASVLDDGEDLIELIWANMYEDFEKVVNNSREYTDRQDELIRKVIHKFNEVYWQYRNIKHDEGRENLGESVIFKLKNVSNSLKIRKAFNELINFYLTIVEPKNPDSYLVITIDDLDLNLREGYDMLNRIHKYLSDSRIIVLVAFDFDQMSSICEKYFLDCMYQKEKSYEESDRIIERARTLCNDYLLKVIPISNRIYLPDKKVIMKKAIIIEDEKRNDVKQFVLGKIAQKLFIYYDGGGIKRHFCMPDTIREFVMYNDFLNSLFTIDWEEYNDVQEIQKGNGKPSIQLYDQNHERFNQDIIERMAYQILNPEQLRLFKTIMDRDIARRAQYAVNFIKNRMSGKSENKKDSVDESIYRYGDILEAIYKLGRLDYDDKALVHCILASFSSEMVREYISYLHNVDEKAKQRAKGRLIQFLGNSFSNEWTGEILPQIKYDETETDLSTIDKEGISLKVKKISFLKRGMGFVPKAEISNLKFEYSDTFRFYEQNQTEYKEQIKKLLNIMTNMVPELECLTLFFNDFRSSNEDTIIPEWKFEINAGENVEGNKYILTVQNNIEQADFDIFNFIGRELENKEKYEDLWFRIATNIKISIKKFLVEKLKISKVLLRKIDKDLLSDVDETVRIKSIFYGSRQKIAFPFYNLDLSYNVIKRVKRSCMSEFSRLIDKSEVYDYLRKVYGFILKELSEEEKFYGSISTMKDDKAADIFLYVSHFKDSPFIKTFGYENEKDSSKGILKKESFNEKLFIMLKTIGIMFDDQKKVEIPD